MTCCRPVKLRRSSNSESAVQNTSVFSIEHKTQPELIHGDFITNSEVYLVYNHQAEESIKWFDYKNIISIVSIIKVNLTARIHLPSGVKLHNNAFKTNTILHMSVDFALKKYKANKIAHKVLR